jgi:hypothetical protein
MTVGQWKMVEELNKPPTSMRLTRREREEVQRVADLGERAVLSMELAGWLERTHARARRTTGRTSR